MTDEQKRRVRAQLKVLGGSDAMAELVILEVSNAEWKGYAHGYRDGKEGSDALNARVEPGWDLE